MLQRFFIYSLLFCSSLVLSAYEVPLVDGGRVDVPEGWNVLDSGALWVSPDGLCAFEVFVWNESNPQRALEMGRPTQAQGDAINLELWGKSGTFGDWIFPAGQEKFRGWFLILPGDGKATRVSAFAPSDEFDKVQHRLLSAVDSYRPEGLWEGPGVVGQFLEITGSQGNATALSAFESTTLEWEISLDAIQASQDVIEREALFLSEYVNHPNLIDAWSRYYRTVYIDAETRMESLYSALAQGPLKPDLHSSADVAKSLAVWMQGFSYQQIAGTSDLLTPPMACATESGDCDSLGLAYLLLCKRYGIDGRLLISRDAKHAVVAIDVPGEGLRWQEENGQSFLILELTTKLPLGVLPEHLIGIDDWFSVNFS